ncbi:glycosyltransferase family 2 protein [uncultured Tateyamaria sp.]|uniref:glycosyltransferase family 2 protein n=1 Tax=uncultured Tateyamaria sp. TaxID=455651 RepID=UPI00262351EE|nr:glycosyltransferase family 2 protein [uncultured Tateyamaria sp.]
MTSTLKITVAALTRKRPRMLATLLDSYGAMMLPENCEVQCLIVENDETDASRYVVDQASQLANGLTVTYVLDTELGIPFGRNRAAKEAIAWGANLLTFVDDDEFVDREWLVEIVARYRKTGAALIGGPVLIPASQEDLTRLERIFHQELTDHYVQRAEGAIPAAEQGRASPVTNNWLGETKLFTEHGIWFDETLRFTGGSDSRFFHTARDMGLHLDWAPKAIVYATMSADRLNFKTQLREAHSRTINRIRLDQVNKRFYWLRLPFSLLLKLISATLLAITLPFTGGKGILKLTRRLGLVTGRISAAFGGNSSLYTKIFGN